MANPTSNFGWQMPTPVDLVTDLPADFEVFGQAVDSSLADLKGGTSGQVLSKNSNTDMDFVWVTSDDANAIQNTIVDAKGDLIAASASDVPARLAVGNNGETLVADSSTSTGLRYQGSIAGGKNFAINGGMDIWQRGTTFTSTGAGYSAYTTDRWTCYAQGTGTITQDTSLSASGFRYGLKFTSTAASSGNDFYQLVETDQTVPLAGKQVAVSGYCIATSGVTPIMNLEYSTTVNDGLFATYVQCTATTISQPTATGSLLRYTYSFAVPTTAKTLRLRASTGTLNNTNYATWTGIQLEVGNVPTSFSRAGGTIQGELAACQRYYYRWTTANGGSNAAFSNPVFAYSTTQAFGTIQFPVTMRITPASVETTGTASNYRVIIGSGVTVCSTVPAIDQANPYTMMIGFPVASGLTVGQGGVAGANISSTAFLGFSAEL
jgi:hypothetical protein